MPRTSVNGINIEYRLEGEGKPLVMIMGLGGAKNAWHAQVKFFRKYFQTVIFDNRGIGKSDKPEGPYSIRMMAEDTIGLMDHLGIQKAHIMGVSMGGMIAQEIALNHPDRVEKLVLGCTFAKSGSDPQEIRDATQSFIESSGSEPAQRQIMATLLDSSFNSRYRRIFMLPIAKIAMRFAPITGMIEQMKAVWTHDTVDRLENIKAQTLVITGTDDRLINPQSSEFLADHIPDSRLVKVEGGGHTFFMEMPEKFNEEVLKFLKGH